MEELLTTNAFFDDNQRALEFKFITKLDPLVNTLLEKYHSRELRNELNIMTENERGRNVSSPTRLESAERTESELREIMALITLSNVI